MAGYIGRQQSQILTNVSSDTVETGDIQDGAVTAAKLDTTYATPSYVDTAESDAVSAANAYTDTAIAGVSSDLVDDTTPQLGGDLDTNGYNVNFTDNVKAQFGASNDLQIFHNGSHSIIQDVGTGNLYVSGTELALVNGDFSQTYALFNSGGGSNLYHNNASKFSTTATGVSVTGDMTLSSNGAVNSELRSDWAGLQLGTTSNHYLAFRTNNTERARLDTSGNLAVSGSVKTVNTAKVWVEFQGSGTVTVRNDFNISSITDIGTGQYTLNFSDALANNNYALVGVSSQAHQLGIVAYDQTSPYTRTTSAVLIRNRRNANSTEDADYISVVLFGDD